MNLGVTLKVWRAAALGRVADRLAVCIDTTDTRSTRVLAELVSALQEEITVAMRSAPSNTSCVVTDFTPVAVVVRGAEVRGRALAPKADETREAVFIHTAALAFLAFELRVSVEACWAEAMRTVVFRNTVGMDSTGSPNAAWVLALALVAALVDRAVVVTTTTIKAPVRLADFPKGTFIVSGAFHFSYASPIITCPLRTTVVFSAANVRVCQTLGVWVAQSLWRACARETMIECFAKCIQSASSNKLARVLALATDTCLVVRTANV